MCATPAPNCYFVSPSERYGAPVRARCSFSVSLAVPDCPWLSLAVPGLLLAAPGCSWLLLAAPGLLLAAHGCSWLPLAVVNVNSRSKENNLLGVLSCHHVESRKFGLAICGRSWIEHRSKLGRYGVFWDDSGGQGVYFLMGYMNFEVPECVDSETRTKLAKF
jgi:hypothetical protein